MLVVAGASLVGLLVDPRIITGAPAWLKPFKFAISTAIYSLTLAWIFGWLPDWPRVRRVVGWTTAIVFVLEVAIIDAQAWRGTTSHFNVSTPLNMVLFVVMGARDPAADARERGGRRRAVAAAVHRPRARMGPASRHDAHHRRRADRPADDAAHGGAARGRPRGCAHDDCGRAHGRRPGRRSRRAGDRLEPRARRSARSALHRPARDAGAGAHRARPAALAPARGAFASGRCWLPRQAMRRCFSCCSGRRCGDKASWRPMRRHSRRSRSGPWSPCSSLGWIGLGSRGASRDGLDGWRYDGRTALFDSEPDDHGSMAAAGVPAAGALDGNGCARGDAVAARGRLRGAGGRDADGGARAGSRRWRA